MAIKEQTKKLLLARSGGFCGNPECNIDLFPLFEKKVITNVEELAHIVAQSSTGPRGMEIILEDIDHYENIILLCPTCHAKIDKFPKLYPIEKIREWKRNHEKRIMSLFTNPKMKTRIEARTLIEKYLIGNKTIFDLFGPFSEKALTNPLETELAWDQKSIEVIIPNNRKILLLVENNYDLLTDKERKIFEVWKLHKDSFEYNKLSADRTSNHIIYPADFSNIFLDEKE